MKKRPDGPVAPVVIRLAACIYFAAMDAQKKESVLWGMLPAVKQRWYVQTAARVLDDDNKRQWKFGKK